MKLLFVLVRLHFFLFSVILFADDSPSQFSIIHNNKTVNHILFLTHKGNTAFALEEYQNYCKEIKEHDFELLENIGLILLDQGFRSKDAEVQLLTLFGAGISANEKALYILEQGLISDQPELQLISLNFLSNYQDDHSDVYLHKAMASNFLLIRLEAALKLALKKDSKAIGQIEGLMSKVDEELWVVFPELYASLGSPEAKKILRKLLTHKDENVRIATVQAIADYSLDDFLPAVRRLATHHEFAQQEVCASAFGELKDEESVPKLYQMTKSPHSHVRLASFNALYQLGRHEYKKEIEDLAKSYDLFAISLLGKISNSEDTLLQLLKSADIQVRLNAALSLLELRDRRSLQVLFEILFKNTRDLAFQKSYSQGKCLCFWRVIPCARQQLDQNPLSIETSLSLRETILSKAVELPENDFLLLANAIFESEQNELIPILIEVLENHPTSAVKDLLKKYQQKVGAPLIRNYCNLALFRLQEPGPYAENLQEWVTKQKNIDLIRFRPMLPVDVKESPEKIFHLTPQETSKLLVEAFESFASMQDQRAIDLLISVIKTGNPKNKYALIGLLMRAIQ